MHALSKQSGSLLLWKCQQTHCGTAVCWLYIQCGWSSSLCCHGVKSQIPLVGLQITWQSQNPNCPYCPCRCLDVMNKKEAEAVLSRSSHWRFYPITVTHTLKESKHIRPKGTTRIQTVSVSSATAQSCYISVLFLTEYSSHKFRHKSCFFPLLPWLSCMTRLSLYECWNFHGWISTFAREKWKAAGLCSAYLLSSEFTVLFIRFLNIYTWFSSQ